MKSFFIRVFIFFSILFLWFSCVNDSGVHSDSIVRGEELTSVEIPDTEEGIISFYSGDVYIFRGENWNPVEIGEFVTGDDKIKVDTDSYCEIQFGDTAMIRIQEESELVINNLSLGDDETDINIGLSVGSVLCKVEKMTGNSSFSVKTQTAVCGVRGTQFRVLASKDGDTVLAVKEGAVSVLPSSIDMDELKEELDDILIDKIRESAQLVRADQEIEIKENVIETTEGLIAEIMEITDNQLLEDKIEELTQVVSFSVEEPVKLSVKNKEELQEIEKMDMIEIPIASGMEEKTVAEELVKIVLNIEPSLAEITVNGIYTGKGKYSGIYKSGDDIKIVIARSGFETETMELIAGKDTGHVYNISLKKIKKSVESTSLSDDNSTNEESDISEKIIKYTFELSVQPEGSSILLDGKNVGENSFSGEYEEGTELKFLVSRNGYKSEEFSYTILKKNNKHEMILELQPIETIISVSKNRLVGNLIVLGANFSVSDKSGFVYSYSFDGKKNWKVKTSNYNNENSYPVIIGNTLVFSGSGELVCINAVSGNIVYRFPLDGLAHRMGRKVVSMNASIIIPTNKVLNIINSVSGKTIQQIEISGKGSTMTPAVWNNQILIADQDGTFLFINPDGRIEGSVATKSIQPVALSIKVVGNKAIIAGRKGYISCIDLNAGVLLWERQLSGRTTSVFTDIDNGNTGIYIHTIEGEIYGLSLTNGADLFNPIAGASSPPLCYNEQLIYGTTKNELVIRSAITGGLIKSLYTEKRITTRPAIGKGKILAGTSSGIVFVINPEGIK